MLDIEGYIFVTFDKKGIHRYPAAATNEKLKEVRFLANEHRHRFFFRVEVEVFHDDRDLEFLIEQSWMENLYDTGTLQLNYKSCEMMSKDLYQHLKERYKDQNRRVAIQISEDGENGSFYKFPAT